jgi:DNA polymerase-4
MTTPIILHIDMDAFFASVEQMDNPALRGRCVIVGGPSPRGVVAAASYEARKYGIRSAMPIFQARQRCRDLVIVPPRRSRYVELSRRIMEDLRDFSPLVEPVSIDEAFVDITGCRRLYGDPLQAARRIKERIQSRIGLTCSVGVAPNKFLAKIASDLEKPDGLTVIAPEQVPDFIAALPVEKVPGVGRRACETLKGLGIQTLGQIREVPEDLLARKMGKFAHRLTELACGRDPSVVTPHAETKSVSTETTLDRDTQDRQVLRRHLINQSQAVARDLRRKGVRARTISLILKTADFRRHSRNRTLEAPVQSAERIFQTALSLLKDFPLTQPVRLVGVGASGLQTDRIPIQADLFPDSRQSRDARWEKVDRAMDAVADRFGKSAVKRGNET